VTLAVTPDEEVYSTGAAALVDDGLDADGVVVGEPTGLDVCTAAKGRFEGTVTLSGVAAHAAEPGSGVSAIAALEPLLAAVRSFDDEHGPGGHDSLGAPTLTPTVVEGGAATNQLPAECRLTLDRRSVPPETAAGFRESLLEHLRAAVPADVELDFSFTERPTPFLEAFATDHDAPLVGTLASASGGSVRPFSAATEASYFAREAPTVVFGPGVLADAEGAVAHAEREYVELREVHAAAEAVTETLDTLLAG
jgi:acetylornithine deacetylase